MQNFFDHYVLTADPGYVLTVTGFEPDQEPAVEAALALVNGYLGVRAALEEGSPVSCPATLIAGVFNTPPRAQSPELQAPVPELVVGPDWSQLRLWVDDCALRLDQAELLEQRRVLDMRQGVLLREWRLRDASGRVTRLRSLRYASLADRHVLVLALEITPENYTGMLSLEFVLDGRVTNENATQHLETTNAEPIADGVLLALRTLQSGYRLAYASHATLQSSSGVVIGGNDLVGTVAVGHRWSWEALAGHSYTAQKLVTVYTSRDGVDPAAAAAEHLARLIASEGAELLAAHTAAWAARWAACDAVIPGDALIQRQVRFACYHLIGAANPHDERSSVGARALTGERYRGHVFWDTEIFVWPCYLYTHPQTARALLLYRYHTLDGARAKAQAMGYRGALYPWEATDTGLETTPDFMLSGGKPVPVLTGVEEHHIAADVAYAVWSYRQISGDEQFFFDYGAEMICEIARFWAGRATQGDDGRYHILRVVGPDEYHESVDDNAYTNGLACWVLQRGLELVAELQRDHPQRWHALAAQLNLTAEELANWEEVAAGLVTGLDPQSGLIEQFRGYHSLAEIDLSDHDNSVATVDARLGWYAMQQTKVLKQADVVMLLFLLWENYAPAVHRANFRYYEPYTSHDSSLSPGFHALFAARLGDLPMAERYLQRAAQIDLDFTRQGLAGAAGGVHIAALGGIWQALAFGFLGLYPQAEGLRFVPHIPRHWRSLQMPLCWRGRQLRVTASADPPTVEIVVLAGEPLQVAVGDGPWQLVGPGAPLRV